MKKLIINDREIGPDSPVFVIAEIGINHEGSMDKAIQMTNDAHAAGCECVKFQRHVVEDEMAESARDVIPGNATESIWNIMERCALTLEDHVKLKAHAESLGMLYFCTPFSRKAADELESIGVTAYKIGSGECNNYPLIKHIAAFGKPIILSTGMNDLPAIQKSVKILEDADVPYGILHCVSIYPTPYEKVSLGAINDLKDTFPGIPVGLSDHSMGIYTCLGAVAYGASILEKHFTSDLSWPGPDVPISLDPKQLSEMIEGAEAIRLANGGEKRILPEEQPTIDFAYATVVSIADISKGDVLDKSNIWVKRPGTGKILADAFEDVLGKTASVEILNGTQLDWNMFQ